jgi:hypothetical protein
MVEITWDKDNKCSKVCIENITSAFMFTSLSLVKKVASSDKSATFLKFKYLS